MITPLRQIVSLYGVQTAYYDITHRRQSAPVESLLAALRSLGAPIASLRDVPAALRELQQALWRQTMEPVIVTWATPQYPPLARGGHRLFTVKVRLPSHTSDASLVGHLTLETGEQRSWRWNGADLPVLDTTEVEGAQYVVKGLPLLGDLPWGYHRFTLEIPRAYSAPHLHTEQVPEALIIVAPLKAYVPPEAPGSRTWGVFLPLYAIRRSREQRGRQGSRSTVFRAPTTSPHYLTSAWPGGSFSDLEALMEWVAGMGGGVVATLPLLAAFLSESTVRSWESGQKTTPTPPSNTPHPGGEPFDLSPYAPASRLLWNEYYLDVARVPELQSCPTVLALLDSRFEAELESLHSSPLVDYRRQMALKRRVLEELSRWFFTGASDRLESLRRFAEAHPVVEDYARFRATGEKHRAPWRSWPLALREGTLREGDYDEDMKRYHLYVQWLAHQQVQQLSKLAREKGPGLYLDLPLGVHPDGYDVWRERDIFVAETSAGAPPDSVFTRGQDWGFPPLSPQRVRERKYGYYIASLRHHLQHAGILRIDHVMGLHRLFWIPKGMEAREGVYVRYRPEELYAILTLESHRNKAIIVGENLGTVPAYVNSAMSRHGLHRMYVAQYELTPNPQRALPPVPAEVVASFNTHDMPPFARFWQGLDIQDRQDMGLLDQAGVQHCLLYTSPSPRD